MKEKHEEKLADENLSEAAGGRRTIVPISDPDARRRGVDLGDDTVSTQAYRLAPEAETGEK